MSIKDDVLAELEKNRGTHISGSELAVRLGVSRNAVWKSIKQLEKQGYDIEAVTNKGYCLLVSNDILSRQSIEKYLEVKNVIIETYDSVGSTNSILREKADEEAPEWTVVIANEQTKGRGRMGRFFYSPKDTGIYMSILLRPKISAYKSINITTCAAVAVARALETDTEIKAGIKWVNDIYVGDKKVCGILTEATTDIEDGTLKYVILGIGINIFPPEEDFPVDIKNIASSVFDRNIGDKDYRASIVAGIINNLSKLYSDIEKASFYEEYKKRSFLLGKEVYIIKKDGNEEVLAVDLDKDFGLIVQKKDGSRQHLNSGEVSVRKIT